MLIHLYAGARPKALSFNDFSKFCMQRPITRCYVQRSFSFALLFNIKLSRSAPSSHIRPQPSAEESEYRSIPI